MQITCVICSDLFTPNSEVFATPCGHIFHNSCLLHWLEISKTCPQCRNKVSEKAIHRVFFNLSNINKDEDVNSLRNQIDNLEYKLKMKEKDVSNVTEKYKVAKHQAEGLRKEVSSLERSERAQNSAILGLKDQIQFFKKRAKECDKLSEEIVQLKQRVKNMENVELVIHGNRREVESIISNETNIEALALFAATLKKSLVDSDNTKRELQHQLKQLKVIHSSCEKTICDIKMENMNTKKELDTLKHTYEKEIKFLKSKFTQLDRKASSSQHSDSLNSSIQRVIGESPVNFNRTPVMKTDKRDSITFTSSTIPKVTKTTTESDSPYLSIRPNGVGLMKQMYTKTLLGADNSKFSIFKQDLQPETKKPNSKEVIYNGLGGSSKEDIFPSPRTEKGGLKRPKSTSTKSSKFKKLSASAGKVNKVSHFL